MKVPVVVGFISMLSFPYMIGKRPEVRKAAFLEKVNSFCRRDPFIRHHLLTDLLQSAV
jgi:hypothetical protein